MPTTPRSAATRANRQSFHELAWFFAPLPHRRPGESQEPPARFRVAEKWVPAFAGKQKRSRAALFQLFAFEVVVGAGAFLLDKLALRLAAAKSGAIFDG